MKSQTDSVSPAKKLSYFPRPSWPVTVVIIVVFALAAGLGWTKLKGNSTNSPSYQTAQAEKSSLIVSISGSGQVSTANTASISTSATGVVTKVLVQNGQTVKMGSPIAQLELDQSGKQKYAQASASYQSAKNALTTAQTNLYTLQASMFGKWDSYKTLSESDLYKDNSTNRTLPEFMISQNEWLATEAQYKTQQAVIAQARTSLNSAALSLQQSSPTIYAPITGTVTGLSLQNGTVISENSSSSSSTNTSTKIASIQTTATPTISLSLSEIDATKVKIGDKATVTFDALPDKSFSGKVISIDTVGAVSSGVTTYPAVVKLDSDSDDIFTNMSAQVNVITDVVSDVFVVPSTAIKTNNGESVIQIMKDGKPQTVVVQTGESSSTQTAITSGIHEGDTIIISTTSPTMNVSSSTGTSPFSAFGGNRAFGVSGAGATTIRINR